MNENEPQGGDMVAQLIQAIQSLPPDAQKQICEAVEAGLPPEQEEMQPPVSNHAHQQVARALMG